MPSAGYSHFYLSAEETAQLKQLGVCQCPRRAILISTHRTKCGIALPSSVSMPSAGYSHFYYADMSRFILMNC